jgi:hypothetical protein
MDDDYRDWVESAPPELRDSRRRSWWAYKYGETLAKDIASFVGDRNEPYPHAIYIEPQDDGLWHVSYHRFISEEEEADAFDNFAHLIGGFLEHHRAALNYVAVEMAKLAIDKDPSLADESLPWSDRLHPTSVEFPIFIKPAKYRSKSKVGKLPQELRSVIESKQPYQGTNYSALWRLQSLAAEFRHRLIHPVAVLPVTDRFEVLFDGKPINVDLDITIPEGGTLKHKDEIMTFAFDRPEGSQANPYPNVAVLIGLDHPLCVDCDLIGLTNQINEVVFRVMRELTEGYVAFRDA